MSAPRHLLLPSSIPNTLPAAPLKPVRSPDPKCAPGCGPLHPKINSFKKLKQSHIRQKNEQGKVIKQYIYKSELHKRSRLNSLDDVKTIESVHSPRSSLSISRAQVHESIIIMRAGRHSRFASMGQQLDPQEPQTPFFKRQITLSEIQSNPDTLKPISTNPALVQSTKLGLLCHYELVPNTTAPPPNLPPHQNILQVYSITPYAPNPQYSLVLYQPYTQPLLQHLVSVPVLTFRQLLAHMQQTLLIITHLLDADIHPCIDPTSLLLSHQSLKLKLRTGYNKTQKQVLRQYGEYYSTVLKTVMGRQSQTPSGGGTVVGMSIGRRLEVEGVLAGVARGDWGVGELGVRLKELE